MLTPRFPRERVAELVVGTKWADEQVFFGKDIKQGGCRLVKKSERGEKLAVKKSPVLRL